MSVNQQTHGLKTDQSKMHILYFILIPTDYRLNHSGSCKYQIVVLSLVECQLFSNDWRLSLTWLTPILWFAHYLDQLYVLSMNYEAPGDPLLSTKINGREINFNLNLGSTETIINNVHPAHTMSDSSDTTTTTTTWN